MPEEYPGGWPPPPETNEAAFAHVTDIDQIVYHSNKWVVVQQIYPKSKKPDKFAKKSRRRYRVRYQDMVVPEVGTVSWNGYYRTYVGARIAAWFHQHADTYGGRVTLEDRGKR